MCSGGRGVVYINVEEGKINRDWWKENNSKLLEINYIKNHGQVLIVSSLFMIHPS